MNAPPGNHFFSVPGEVWLQVRSEKEGKITHLDASRRFGTILELRARKRKSYIQTKVKGSVLIRSRELLLVQQG